MEAARVAEAARLLVEARRTGEPLSALPDSCKPVTAADANAIIDAVTDQLDEVIVGWKIGFLYAPRQKPFLCPLFQSRVFNSPARVPLSLTPSRRIEPEICFRLTQDLPGRQRAYRAEEVAACVVACPSLEIVDTRFDTRHRSIRQMLDARESKIEAFADHITTGAYVLGEGRTDWQEFDFASIRIVMRTPERIIVESLGGHAFVDPFLPSVVLVTKCVIGGGCEPGRSWSQGLFPGSLRWPPRSLSQPNSPVLDRRKQPSLAESRSGSRQLNECFGEAL